MGPIENPPDNHDHCIACLGLAHAEAALEESDCAQCAHLLLRVLRTRRNVACGFFGVSPTAANVLLVGPPPPLEGGDDNLVQSHRSQRSPRSPETFSDGYFHGLGYQPTLQTMQDDSPSSQQGLLLGWGGSRRPTCYGVASSVPGQAPAVPGGRDCLIGSSEQFV